MRKMAVSLIGAVMAVSFTTTAHAATTPRADRYYVVVCNDGNEYESVDAHAVEQGGKADAVALFSQNTPFGLTCWLEGPFVS
jgi:hypothetical protein